MLGIDYPFIQAPMLVVTTPQMVAAASESGALGSLPLGYASADKASAQIRAVKALTGKPFAVNLFAYEQPHFSGAALPSTLDNYYKKFNIKAPAIPPADPFTSYKELIGILIEEGVAAVSFHFGMPGRDTVARLKQAGIPIMNTATSVREARLIEDAGIDIIVAQGTEAGGNRGSFLDDAHPQVGLISLLPQVCDAVRVPVIAAGGIMQPRSAAAAFLLGASGVQLGSIFLRSTESGATPAWKTAVAKAADEDTVLTRAWSGRYGRCLPTAFVRDIKDSEILPSPFQQFVTGALREEGRKIDQPDIQSFWAGQSAAYAEERSTPDILKTLIDGTAQLLSQAAVSNGR